MLQQMKLTIFLIDIGVGNSYVTPNSSNSNNAFNLNNNGQVNTNNAYNGNAVRPVLYLDSSVYVMDGNGSVSDPYIIGM